MDAMNAYGRTKSIVSLGVGQSSLEDVLARHAATDARVVKPDPESEKGYFYRADHFEFARQGVPEVANGSIWPTWKRGSEFRARREKALKARR